MIDTVDRATRSRVMSRIRAKDTGPELLLRRVIHARGFRFRLHAVTLPGKPDLVFPRYKAACFVHGCFWHRHPGCRFATTPASNSDYWRPKLERNEARDVQNREKLLELGWRVAVIWACALRSGGEAKVATELAEWLRGSSPTHEATGAKMASDVRSGPADDASA